MATIGFKKAIISVPKTNGVGVDKYIIDKSGGGTIEASISGISAEQTTVYASNIPIYVNARGVGEIGVSLNVFDLYANGVYEKVLGIERDENGIAVVGENTEAPYVSVTFVSDTPSGREMYFGVVKGRFSHPEIALGTTESGGTDPNTETIEGTFITDHRGYAYMSGVQDDTLTIDTFMDKLNNDYSGGGTIPDVGTYAIGGRVWEDKNGDNIYGEDDVNYTGFSVSLVSGHNNDEVIDTQIADDNGYFTFSSLSAGKYRVKYKISTLGDYEFVTKTDATDFEGKSKGSNANADGYSDIITLGTSNPYLQNTFPIQFHASNGIDGTWSVGVKKKK